MVMSRGLPPSRLSRIDAVILEELRKVENDPQIQQADVMEWSTETVKA